jgi:hypothetical protein
MLDLIDRLLRSVENMKWSYDSSTDGYFVDLSPHIVEIRSMDRDQHHPYGLVVLEGASKVIESVVSNEEGLPAAYVKKLEDLYLKAKRAEKNLDGVLDSILNKLPDGGN